MVLDRHLLILAIEGTIFRGYVDNRAIEFGSALSAGQPRDAAHSQSTSTHPAGGAGIAVKCFQGNTIGTENSARVYRCSCFRVRANSQLTRTGQCTHLVDVVWSG